MLKSQILFHHATYIKLLWLQCAVYLFCFYICRYVKKTGTYSSSSFVAANFTVKYTTVQCSAPHIITDHKKLNLACKGKSLSEALIFASTNPQYDDRLFNELQVQ